jgi:hypothetical protein
VDVEDEVDEHEHRGTFLVLPLVDDLKSNQVLLRY